MSRLLLQNSLPTLVIVDQTNSSKLWFTCRILFLAIFICLDCRNLILNWLYRICPIVKWWVRMLMILNWFLINKTMSLSMFVLNLWNQNRFVELAKKVLKICLKFGASFVNQSDDGREFVNSAHKCRFFSCIWWWCLHRLGFNPIIIIISKFHRCLE